MISCARVQFEQRTRELINGLTVLLPAAVSKLSSYERNTGVGNLLDKPRATLLRHLVAVLSNKMHNFYEMCRPGLNSNLLYICQASLPLPLANVSSNGHTLTHQFSGDSFLAWS